WPTNSRSATSCSCTRCSGATRRGDRVLDADWRGSSAFIRVKRSNRKSDEVMKKAVVLVSGGMDSAVVLAMAREQGFACHALSVAYGPWNTSWLDAAAGVAADLGADEHKMVRVHLRRTGASALTHDIAVPEAPGEGIPVAYVPGRNPIMLS